MTTTAVSICNSALIKVGADRISALSDTTPRAILCNEQFAKIRNAVLAAHPWNFAITRVALASVADYDDPLDQWAYQFTLPSDCLRVLNCQDSDIEFVIENGYLLSDESSISIRYIKEETDYSKYQALALDALSTRLAVELAYAIVQSRELGDSLMVQYRSHISEARGIDGQEGRMASIEITDWTDVRQ